MKKTSMIVVALLAAAQVARAERVSALAVARDGKTLVVASSDKSVRLLALPGGAELRRVAFPEVPMAAVLSPNGKTLAVGGFATLILYDAASGKALVTVPDPVGHMSINALAFSPDGKTLAAAGDGGRVKLFDAVSAKELRALAGFSKIVNAIAWAPDGKSVAAAGVDNTVALWSASGEPGLTLRGHKTWIAALIFTPDGKRLVSVDQNANVLVWDRASGQQLEALAGNNGWTYAVAASPDGRRLAWGAEEGVQLWDLAAKQPAAKLATPRAQITAVVYTPDGKSVIAGDYSGGLYLLDIAAKTRVALPK